MRGMARGGFANIMQGERTMNKLWAGRSEAETSALADAFNSSIAVDGRMYQQDITGSMAHAAMLAKCGILTQAAFQMENLDPEYVIVGIGINLYMPTEGFGKELQNIAGSVLQKQSGDIKNKILAETLNRYFYYYKNFAKKEFIAEYKKRSLVLGKGIRVVTKDGERKATALDIDDMCHLLVEYEDGTRENLSTGEISIRLQ